MITEKRQGSNARSETNFRQTTVYGNDGNEYSATSGAFRDPPLTADGRETRRRNAHFFPDFGQKCRAVTTILEQQTVDTGLELRQQCLP